MCVFCLVFFCFVLFCVCACVRACVCCVKAWSLSLTLLNNAFYPTGVCSRFTVYNRILQCACPNSSHYLLFTLLLAVHLELISLPPQSGCAQCKGGWEGGGGGGDFQSMDVIPLPL